MVPEIQGRSPSRNDDAERERVGDGHVMSSRAGREDQTARRVQRGVAGQHKEVHAWRR